MPNMHVAERRPRSGGVGVRTGDLVSWSGANGGTIFGHVLEVKGGRVRVVYGSGNKETRKWLPASELRIREPR